MKKILFCLALALSVQSFETVLAQKVMTEGVIMYDLKVEGAEELGMMAAMLPTEMTIKFKGTKSRSEFATGMSETIAINDSKDNNSGVVLIDLMGKKYALKIGAEKVAQQKANQAEYDAFETKESKMIAGYNCKKVILVNKKNKDEVSIYYTPEIPNIENNLNGEFNMVKGMPMEFMSTLNNIKMTVTVKEVKKVKVEDSNFTVPAEYKMTTQEELMKGFGAGGE